MLHIYVGPMYAGKTSKLIEMFNLNIDTKKVIIDYDLENNMKCYDGILKNHDELTCNTIKCKSLYDTINIYECNGNLALSHDMTSVYSKSYNTTLHGELFKIPDKILFSNDIYINEAQFYPDLYEFVLEMLKKKKNIYLYGLDGDFQQKKIGRILDLVPYCDTICKLKAHCTRCNKDAIYSHRITSSKEQYLPDESAYIPLCRSCFYNII